MISKLTLSDDLASKKWLIECIDEGWIKFDTEEDKNRFIHLVKDIAPTIQPSIHGYSIAHLELIARILQKENLPPERVAEALTDIGKIVDIIVGEFEDSLRRSINQCFSANRLKTTAFNCDEVKL